MRHIGTTAMGIRLPIINANDDLASITAKSLFDACAENNITLAETDVVGVTEAIVAKAQGNYANICHIGADVAEKFKDAEAVGVVFPILSRNRFINLLKGIALGAKKVYVLLSYPCDCVGNPIIDEEMADKLRDVEKPIDAARFRQITGGYTHPFTCVDYIEIYEHVADNVEVYVSDAPTDILRFTDCVIAADIHRREITKRRLINGGARIVYTLADILSEPVTVDGVRSGFNPEYGILGSNIADNEKVKLFPRECSVFLDQLKLRITEKFGLCPEMLVYGDGAFKDPTYGIWELADPVVSPAYTERLSGSPFELKLKYIAETNFGGLDSQAQREAVIDAVKKKNSYDALSREGTTPRVYSDLIGSLCDLVSGSGDKGTPVILIKGYFDDYTAE